MDERDESIELAGELGIPFPLLRDADLSVAMAYGVAMEGEDIAIPATFVIDRAGRIHWRKVGESMADRPSIEAIAAALDRASRGPM